MPKVANLSVMGCSAGLAMNIQIAPPNTRVLLVSTAPPNPDALTHAHRLVDLSSVCPSAPFPWRHSKPQDGHPGDVLVRPRFAALLVIDTCADHAALLKAFEESHTGVHCLIESRVSTVPELFVHPDPYVCSSRFNWRLHTRLRPPSMRPRL